MRSHWNFAVKLKGFFAHNHRYNITKRTKKMNFAYPFVAVGNALYSTMRGISKGFENIYNKNGMADKYINMPSAKEKYGHNFPKKSRLGKSII